MIGPDGREVVTVNQAMEICGVSRRTVYNWIMEGKVERIYTAGNTPRIYKEDLYKVERKKEE